MARESAPAPSGKVKAKVEAKVRAHTKHPEQKIWKVSLAGFGTVGRSVAKILVERTGAPLRLTHICNRNVARKKVDWLPHDVVWTENIDDVLSSDADIVVEVIGGLQPTDFVSA